jgi:nucleotide-binding universal stress UspA family protein
MRILVPYDGSEQSKEALRHALGTYPDAEVDVLHVIDPVGRGGEKQPKAAWWNMWYEDRQHRSEEVLEEAQEVAEDHGRTISTAHEVGKPSGEILGYVGNHDIDRIVMGRQGETGLSRVLLGSVADNVARHADLPVTLVGETN